MSAELEQARAMLEANDRELTSMRDTLLGANREIEQLRGQIHQLDDSLVGLARASRRRGGAAVARARRDPLVRRAPSRSSSASATKSRAQVAGLESELKDEKENAENLGEIANERRELLTKLQEKVEEAEERYEEAKYRLTKAAHFERLVKRRKGLVTKLLNALRQKQKANTALKAGARRPAHVQGRRGDESAEAPAAHRRAENGAQGSRGDDRAPPRHDQREGRARDVRDEGQRRSSSV